MNSLQNFAQANQSFGKDIFSRIAAKNGNTQFSPFTLNVGLAMLVFGMPDQKDKDRLLASLHVNNGLAGLGDYIETLNDLQEANDVKGMEVLFSTGLFPHLNLAIKNYFLAQAETGFGATVTPVNYGEAAKAVETINNWASEKTKQKIKGLLQASDIQPLTILTIANALYLKGDWKVVFNEEDSYEGEFKGYDQKTSATYMSKSEKMSAYESNEGTYVQLPFVNEKFGLVFFLPREYDALREENIAKTLSTVDFINANRQMSRQAVNLILPKVDYTERVILTQTLKEAGLEYLFGQANFSGIADRVDEVQDVIQKTNLTVNEQGAEMAAANAIIMATRGGGGPRKINAHFNRPYLVAFMDLENGMSFLWSKITDPSVTGDK